MPIEAFALCAKASRNACRDLELTRHADEGKDERNLLVGEVDFAIDLFFVCFDVVARGQETYAHIA